MQIYFSHFPSQAGSDGSLLTEIPAAVGATLGSSLDWSAPEIHHKPVSKSIVVPMGFYILFTNGTPDSTPLLRGVPTKIPNRITCTWFRTIATLNVFCLPESKPLIYSV